ncbi:hypothetical protein AgCh_032073 [Apium graveolens]
MITPGGGAAPSTASWILCRCGGVAVVGFLQNNTGRGVGVPQRLRRESSACGTELVRSGSVRDYSFQELRGVRSLGVGAQSYSVGMVSRNYEVGFMAGSSGHEHKSQALNKPKLFSTSGPEHLASGPEHCKNVFSIPQVLNFQPQALNIAETYFSTPSGLEPLASGVGFLDHEDRAAFNRARFLEDEDLDTHTRAIIRDGGSFCTDLGPSADSLSSRESIVGDSIIDGGVQVQAPIGAGMAVSGLLQQLDASRLQAKGTTFENSAKSLENLLDNFAVKNGVLSLVNDKEQLAMNDLVVSDNVTVGHNVVIVNDSQVVAVEAMLGTKNLFLRWENLVKMEVAKWFLGVKGLKTACLILRITSSIKQPSRLIRMVHST